MRVRLPIIVLLLATLACRSGRSDDGRAVVTFAGSALGAEGAVLARQVARFELANPGIHVRIQHTPDDATQRHQLRSEEHTSELQSHVNLVCRLLLEKKNTQIV